MNNLGTVVKINKKNAKLLGIIDGDIVIIEDILSGVKMPSVVTIDTTIPDNIILMEKEIGESIGLTDGIDVTIKKFSGVPKRIEKLILGVLPTDGTEASEKIAYIYERRFLLKKYLDGKIVSRDITYIWKDLNVKLKVIDTEPSLSYDDIAIITRDEIKEVSLKPLYTSSFNGVLLIDISHSMGIRDMIVRNVDTVISSLKDQFLTEARDISLFFDELMKYKKEDAIVTKRYLAAALATLVFLAEKVGRGRGEKVAFITFSNEARIIPVCSQKWFESGLCNLSEVMLTIIKNITKAPHGSTNISDALRKAIEVAIEMSGEKLKPTMFVLLTDGGPHKVDSEERVLFVANEISERMNNVVIYTLGIGGYVHEDLMKQIAESTGGSYYRVRDISDLLYWFSSLAKDFFKRLKMG